MNLALKNGERITATPKDKANCPLCKEEVIAKCGSIKIWHWSHISNKDCDNWWEPETEWHLNWKNEFPKEQQEVTIGKHRADIQIDRPYRLGKFTYKNKFVIELQNSFISLEDVKKREETYKYMCWLINGKTFAKGLEFTKSPTSYIGFKWKYFSKAFLSATKDIYVDLGDKILWIKKLYENEKHYESQVYNSDFQQPTIIIQTKKYPVSGWGYLITKEEFLKRFR